MTDSATITFHQACHNSVTSLTSAQADYVYTLSSVSTEQQIGPTFSLSTDILGCSLDVSAYVWDDVNAAWVAYDNTFDFWVDCVACSG